MKNQNRVRRNRGKNQPDSQGANNTDGATIASAADDALPFFDFENFVYRSVALLRLFSNHLSERWVATHPRNCEDAACGLESIARDCALDLKNNWRDAFDEACKLKAGQKYKNQFTVALCLDVEKAISLVNMMAEQLTEIMNRDDEAEARRRGEQPTVAPSGYICLAQEFENVLRAAYEHELAAWSAMASAREHRAVA